MMAVIFNPAGSQSGHSRFVIGYGNCLPAHQPGKFIFSPKLERLVEFFDMIILLNIFNVWNILNVLDSFTQF